MPFATRFGREGRPLVSPRSHGWSRSIPTLTTGPAGGLLTLRRLGTPPMVRKVFLHTAQLNVFDRR
jgi:hypothetical protein